MDSPYGGGHGGRQTHREKHCDPAFSMPGNSISGKDIPMSRTSRRRIAQVLLTFTLATTVAAGGSAIAYADQDSPDTKRVDYQGYTFDVPKSWPVLDLAQEPTTCVRFDRHAVYLGTPSAAQDCPSKIVGKTEAFLVEPADTSEAALSTENATAREISATAPRIKVTATYDTDRAAVRAILSGAALPDPRSAAPQRSALSENQDLRTTAATPNTTNYIGKGFDACAAPNSNTMNAWRNNSPYRSVGIYIGGAERGCSQPNLTAGWVQQQAAAGWHFMPLYVGVQAPRITSPQTQGSAAADDAINQASALGLGPGSLLYYDMEAYGTSLRPKVLQFLSAWTTQLHARGYKSAVYSSSDSGIKDLANNVGGGYALPDVIFSALWNNVANTADPAVAPNLWANHQRVHQYTGNITESYGGVSINIDRDYLDVV
ncbi:DUF1906 domain-containing protein, partial [Embleya sp. NPDC001921]